MAEGKSGGGLGDAGKGAVSEGGVVEVGTSSGAKREAKAKGAEDEHARASKTRGKVAEQVAARGAGKWLRVRVVVG